jgi:hypothetical protein
LSSLGHHYLCKVFCVDKAEAIHLVLRHPPAQRIQQQLTHNWLACSNSNAMSPAETTHV